MFLNNVQFIKSFIIFILKRKLKSYNFKIKIKKRITLKKIKKTLAFRKFKRKFKK